MEEPRGKERVFSVCDVWRHVGVAGVHPLTAASALLFVADVVRHACHALVLP